MTLEKAQRIMSQTGQRRERQGRYFHCKVAQILFRTPVLKIRNKNVEIPLLAVKVCFKQEQQLSF